MKKEENIKGKESRGEISACETQEVKKDAAENHSDDAKKTATKESLKNASDSKASDDYANVAAEPPKEDFEDKYMRLMADFQNYKRRIEKEKKDIYAYANEKLIAQLLDVLDNFDRAQEQVKSAVEEQIQTAEAFSEGLEMIYTQLLGILTDAGLKEIIAEEQDFDPELHNAVISEDGGVEKTGKVTAILKKGYTYNDKVIRHSMVKVGI